MRGNDLQIYVAVHEKCESIFQNEYYIPLQVGKAIGDDLGYLGDDTGDNISEKSIYSELRGHYWFWKNTDTEYVGLVHYRRYFARSNIFWSLISADGFEVVLDNLDVDYYLCDYDIIVTKIHFLYDDNHNTVRFHTRTCGYEKYLDAAGQVIEDICPEYAKSFYQVMESDHLYPNNILIGKKVLVDQYCQWLFSILFELEQRMYNTGEPIRHRVMGAINEVLLKVWLDKENKRVKLLPRIKTDDHNIRYIPFKNYDHITVAYEPTKDGWEVLRLTDGTKAVYMGSKYTITKDIQAILTKIQDPCEMLIVFGLGSGDYLPVLLELLPAHIFLTVVEPKPEIIKHFIDKKTYLLLEKYNGRLQLLPFDKRFVYKIFQHCESRAYSLVCYLNYNKIYERDFVMLEMFLEMYRKNNSSLDTIQAAVDQYVENFSIYNF